MHEESEWGLVCMNDITACIFLSASVLECIWQHGETGGDGCYISGAVRKTDTLTFSKRIRNSLLMHTNK